MVITDRFTYYGRVSNTTECGRCENGQLIGQMRLVETRLPTSAEPRTHIYRCPESGHETKVTFNF